MNDYINVDSAIVPVSRKFINERLNECTNVIKTAVLNVVQSADEANRTIAKTLALVGANKLYTEDGFNSLAEYAEAIGIKKARAHQLANAGTVYNDESAPDALKEFTPSKLGELASLIKDDKTRERVYEDVKSGTISADCTQDTIRSYANDIKAETGKAKGKGKKSKKSDETATVVDVKDYRLVIDIHGNGEDLETAVFARLGLSGISVKDEELEEFDNENDETRDNDRWVYGTRDYLLSCIGEVGEDYVFMNPIDIDGKETERMFCFFDGIPVVAYLVERVKKAPERMTLEKFLSSMAALSNKGVPFKGDQLTAMSALYYQMFPNN